VIINDKGLHYICLQRGMHLSKSLTELVFALPAWPIRRLYSRGFCHSKFWRQCCP